MKKEESNEAIKESQDADASLDSLFSLCRVLRGEEGCSWDRSQTVTSLTPYILEEAHELIDAIAAGERAKLAEEIGDLVFLLVFCIEIAREEGFFTLKDVVKSTEDKMKRRHPHVFGDKAARKPEEVRKQWEEIKLQEEPEQSSLLDGLSPTLSPLIASFRLQEKAAAVGFDWPKAGDVIANIREELQELEDALSEGRPEIAGPEIGDLLFSLVNVARKLGEDPEVCLKRTITKFQRRFAHIERALAGRGKTPSGSTLEEMDRLWNQAKEEEQE